MASITGFIITFTDRSISFISVFADGELIADELNPLTISHIARNISFETIGRTKILKPIAPNPFAVNNDATAMRPLLVLVPATPPEFPKAPSDGYFLFLKSFTPSLSVT